MKIDGYRSSSLEKSVALTFAARNETDELDKVILEIRMENRKSKYYICLDREDYSLYRDEREVLL